MLPPCVFAAFSDGADNQHRQCSYRHPDYVRVAKEDAGMIRQVHHCRQHFACECLLVQVGSEDRHRAGWPLGPSPKRANSLARAIARWTDAYVQLVLGFATRTSGMQV
jgi:hypothetical protein